MNHATNDFKDAMAQKCPEYLRMQHKVIFLDGNVPPHRRNDIRDIVESLDWALLTHAGYLPVLTPYDYHLLASTGHALSEQRFNPYENNKK